MCTMRQAPASPRWLGSRLCYEHPLLALNVGLLCPLQTAEKYSLEAAMMAWCRAGREYKVCVHWPRQQGHQHAVLLA